MRSLGQKMYLIRLVGSISLLSLGVPMGNYAAWSPLPPPPDEFDWIQLTSGEWLKGEIKEMYDYTVEFDSDKLGLLDIDWDDVAQMHSARSQMVRYGDRQTATGKLFMKGDELVVTESEKDLVINRSDVFSIAAGSPKKLDLWSAKATVGANIGSGNTEQADWNTLVTIQHRTANNRFYFDYIGTFSKTEGIETANSHRTNSYFDISFTKKFFVRPFAIESFANPFQNIDNRYSLGAGVGYNIKRNSKTEWDTTTEISYQLTRFSTVQVGEQASDEALSFSVGSHFVTEITEWLDLNGIYELRYADEASGGVISHSITSIEFEITNRLNLNVSFVWDWTANPIPDATGKEPEENDFQFIFGIGLDL